MKASKLYRQSDDFCSGEWPAAAPKKRPKATGIQENFSKKTSVAERATAMGWIRATYADAIEFTMTPSESMGVAFCMGILFAVLAFGFAIAIWPVPITLSESDIHAIIMASISSLVGIACLIFAGIELFGTADVPVIFDRGRRKVYLPFSEDAPAWKYLKEPDAPGAIEYDWDLIDAEHRSDLVASGKTMVLRSMLYFHVRKSADDPTIIGTFLIGFAEAFTEQSVRAVWEHIRRFMEEGGPHLPLGEKAVVLRPPLTYLQALRDVLCGQGWTFWEWGKTYPWRVFTVIVLFPLFVPMYALWGLGNWLAYKTASPYYWPQEVLQIVGPPSAGESACGTHEAPALTSAKKRAANSGKRKKTAQQTAASD